MSARLFALTATLFAASALAACSSQSSSEGDDATTSPTTTSTSTSTSATCAAYDASKDDLTKPTAFAADVVPVLQRSCGLSSSCHGSARAPMLGMSLDSAAMHDGLVGKPSRALPKMPYVTASRPEESFLMHKLDGDACMFDAECTQKSCGEPMPLNGTPMPAETRALIRRWIAQGAKAD